MMVRVAPRAIWRETRCARRTVIKQCLATTKRSDPLLVGIRVVRIVVELATIQFRRMRGVQVEVRARKIREAFVRLGPAFVKIGQALSTRRDALPLELCDELSRLQDEMPESLSGAEATRLIERELGAPVSELFVGLNAMSRPIAAASLGQVYRATEARTGKVVAVKVQRDDVADIVTLDASALRVVAVAFGWLSGARSDLASIVDEVVGRIADELDYEREAKHAERFASLYGHLASVPSVCWRLTSGKVLTLTWIDGVKLEKWARSVEASNRTDLKRALVDRGVACTVTQFFETGFFHADPHPGNLLVTPVGGLCYLDFGKMGELRADDRVALMTLLVHFVNRDARGLAKDFVDLGCILSHGKEYPPFSDPPPSLVTALESTLTKRVPSLRTASRLSFQGVFNEVRDALPGGRHSPLSFRLPARFAVVVRALGALEGAVLAIDPSFRVVAAAYPHVARALVKDTSPDGRRALLQLLVDPSTGAVRWSRLRALASITSGADAIDALGAPFVATLLEDVIRFLDSSAGMKTAANLVCDAKDAIDSPASRAHITVGRDALDQLVVVILNRPEVWLPVLTRCATSPRLIAAISDVSHHALVSLSERLPNMLLLLLSACVREFDRLSQPSEGALTRGGNSVAAPWVREREVASDEHAYKQTVGRANADEREREGRREHEGVGAPQAHATDQRAGTPSARS